METEALGETTGYLGPEVYRWLVRYACYGWEIVGQKEDDVGTVE